MQIQLIRNATLRLTYNQHLILVDPFLAAKGTVRSFAGIAPNPTVDLPISSEAVIAGVEMVLVSHLHTDHFDETAQTALPKNLPLYCQPGDEAQIQDKGFQQVTPVSPRVAWNGIEITRTPGQHGTGGWAERMGKVSGFVLRAPGEPSVYWVGDSIWYSEVAVVVAREKPDIIITHSGGARFGPDEDPILMDIDQTLTLCEAAPKATVVAVHMEALDHCTVAREALRRTAMSANIPPSRLRIPADGETVSL